LRTPSPPLLDREEVARALALIVAPGQAFEVRILEPRYAARTYNPRVAFGYFDDPRLAVEALVALRLAAAKGVYATLNPVDPTLLARGHNRFSDAKTDGTTPDKHILSRRWMLVDFDPVRPAEVSASDGEKAHAAERCRTVLEALRSEGWPEPVVADSGNGFHQLYRVDLPADDGRVQRVLQALDLRFSDAEVKIDTAVFNPARIVKLYGTKAMKGDDCPALGRPHRMSRLLEVPDQPVPVPPELLDAMAGSAMPGDTPRTPAARHPASKARSGWDRARLEAFIARHLGHCDPGPATPYADGHKWVLRVCPFDPSHANRSAVVVQRANGALAFRCQHDGCRGNDWKALRALCEPADGQAAGRETPTVEPADGDEELIARCGPPVLLNAVAVPTDINQMFVAARHQRDNLILFEPTLALFYCYDEPTGLWKPKTESRVLVDMADSLPALLDAYGAAPLLRKRSEAFMAQCLRFLKGMVEDPDVFQRRAPVIHVGNGVLHLDESPPALHGFSPDYYSRNRSEVCYDPSATCPRFLGELLRPALPGEDISLLQRYAGLCLLGGNPAQRFLILRGTAGGGKSTLVEVLETIVGTHNVAQLRVHLLAERFEIASFIGKTLLCGKDVPGDFLDNRAAHVLKPLTGGDRLSAEQKNVKHRFEVVGDFAAIITTNTRLHVQLDSDAAAWRRRMLIVDFTQPPSAKPIPHFARELVRTEGPGILNWCVQGAVRLLRELETSGHMQLTETQKQRVETLLCESDSVRHFVLKCVRGDPAGTVTVSELLAAYSGFCEAQGWQAVPVRRFESQVCDHMVTIHRAHKRTDIRRSNKNQRGYARVSLQTADCAAVPEEFPPDVIPF
jgi:P4 family phage/plasmid primase-like protien